MADQSDLSLIVGLGNPGEQYSKTRHNAGFWYIEKLAERYHITLKEEAKFHGLTGRGKIDGKEVRLLLPMTFMNRSGQAVNAVARFYQIPSQQILVVHDELDLPAGQIRLKQSGGHGGHNGLRDIHPQIGSDYHRLRVGIGHPGHKDLVTAHVLGKPSAEDMDRVNHAIDEAVRLTPLLLNSKEHENARQVLHSIK